MFWPIAGQDEDRIGREVMADSYKDCLCDECTGFTWPDFMADGDNPCIGCIEPDKLLNGYYYYHNFKAREDEDAEN